MHGQVLGIDATTGDGQISGDDGQRYAFSAADWKLPTPPHAGARVDFQASDGKALAIYAAQGGGGVADVFGTDEKSKMVAGLLAIFLGALGIHKFYLGRNTPGIIMLAVSLVGSIAFGLGPMVMGIVGLIEGIIYLTKSDAEFHEIYVVQGKDWF